MPTISLDPCEACKVRLRDILTVQGVAALKAQVVNVLRASPACHSQIPRRPDAVLVTNLDETREQLTLDELEEAGLMLERALALCNELHDRFEADGLDRAQRMAVMVSASVRLGVRAGYELADVLRGVRNNLMVFELEGL